MVLAVDDDHVLGTADDEDAFFRQIAHVAGIEPAIGRQCRCGGFIIAEIAGHDTKATHEHPAYLAIGQHGAGFIADFDGQARHGLAAIDDGAIPRRLAGIAAATGAAGERAFVDEVGDNAFAQRHDRDRQRRFGEAIARQKGARLETGGGEHIDERLHHFGADHVGAVARDPPARQVEARRNIDRGRNAPGANVIAKGWRITERIAGVAADQRQPA